MVTSLIREAFGSGAPHLKIKVTSMIAVDGVSLLGNSQHYAINIRLVQESHLDTGVQ